MPWLALAASAALIVSDIPYQGPASEVRVAKIDGKYVVNPKTVDLARATLELIVGATEKDITMVEGELNEAQEEEIIEALKVAHEVIKDPMPGTEGTGSSRWQNRKTHLRGDPSDPELEARVREFCYDKVYAVAQQGSANKQVRKDGFQGGLRLSFWRPSARMRNWINHFSSAISTIWNMMHRVVWCSMSAFDSMDGNSIRFAPSPVKWTSCRVRMVRRFSPGAKPSRLLP